MKSENKRGFLTRRTFGLTFSTAALTSALPLRFARGDTAVTLKLGHSLTRGSHYDVAAVAFAESLKAKSGGKIEVQIFPQSQQCVGLIDHFKRDLTTCIALQIDSDGARTGPSTTLSGRSADRKSVV